MTGTDEDRDFEALLEYLRDHRSFDFTGYKRSTLMRRVTKRMEAVGVPSFTDYLDRLQVDPEEFTRLFDVILINVTSFFRDEEVWSYLASDLIPAIVRGKAADEPIRVWDAGCASGEEAYTLAMLLAEELGMDRFVRRVKIYATDADGEALELARQGAFDPRQLAAVPAALAERYFTRGPGESSVVDPELRREVIFGRHDLVKDAPISRVDLLVCRNTLMYFNAEIQTKILANFHYALAPAGVLVLGKSEMLFTRVDSFVPVDRKLRVFRPGAERADGAAMRAPRPVGGDDAPRDGDGHRRQRTAAFETGPLPQLVVSGDGRLTLANAQARRLLRLNEADVGRPLRDLEVSYRPVELRSQIELAHQTQQEIVLRGVTLPVDGQELRLEVQIVPLDGADGEALGTSVTFNDVTRHRRLEDELNASRQALETAMEELQSTNEELETTNEELQSTNEELETVNEELQSTNEELETMNAELQSTNEALQAVNDEAERRAEERDRLTLYLGSIMESLRGGMLVVDRELKIEVWNRHAEDLWGLRSDEVVGHHLLSLDVGLPVDRLAGPLRACLAGSQESLDVEATTRRGRSIVCTVSCTPLADRAGEVTGAIVVMEEREGAL